jgi:hypothetical protein
MKTTILYLTLSKTSSVPHLLRRAATLVGLALLICGCNGGSSGLLDRPSKKTPIMEVLPLFSAPDVPAVGPEELPGDPPRWIVSTKETDPNLPGEGLAQHPMLYIGEGCNTMFLVNGGKVIWTYSTGKGWEYDDVWLMSNGNILFSRMGWAAEVTPQKKIVWHMEASKAAEIHTVQPIGLDRVLLMQNGTPPKLMIINKKTGAVEVEHAMPDDGKGVHAQFRRLRMTAKGTYLVPFLQMHKVVEYDKDFREVWSYAIKTPWAAVRLHNGNTLITDEGDKLTREVSPKGETVWEIRLSELPPEARLADSQSCVRLANGNTILCSRGDGGKRPQLVEVTPDKKAIWVLNDWRNLGPATALQILDDPGIPERPGDLQR